MKCWRIASVVAILACAIRVDRDCAGAAADDATAPEDRDVGATLTPARGTVVHPGERVTIVLHSQSTQALDGLLTIGDKGAIISGTGPYTWTVPVPNMVGRLNILALARQVQASTYLDVQPASHLVSLDARPTYLDFTDSYDEVGDFLQIVVSGQFADGKEIPLDSLEQDIHFTTESGTQTVVDVQPNGVVTVRGSGQDAVIASYGGYQVRVPVSVRLYADRRP